LHREGEDRSRATRRSGSAGGTRNARYRTALSSAKETGACIDVPEALGYVEGVERLLLEKLDQIRAILVRVTT